MKTIQVSCKFGAFWTRFSKIMLFLTGNIWAIPLKAEVGMVTSEFRHFCENRKSTYRSKVSMRIQHSRPFFMTTWISQSDFEVLAQILESFVRYSVLMKLDVISCSDELRRWFWVEIALEFHSELKYTH